MLYKLSFFEISCSKIERKEPGARTLVKHEHRKRIGWCKFDTLDDITYNNPTLQGMCVAPLKANLLITNINKFMFRDTIWDESNFDHNCPFIRGLRLDLHENELVRPDDESPNICSELLDVLKAAGSGSHLNIVTMETDVYVHRRVNDDHYQFIKNIRKLYRPLTKRIIGVTKVSIRQPKKSLKDASIGDSLELLTMRLRQRICAICHANTDDILSERRITCLPCSHLFHEDCVMAWLMERSYCPLCGIKISIDKVACKLPRNWPRRHMRNGPNFYKVLKRIPYLLGPYLSNISWLAQTVLFLLLLEYGAVKIFWFDLERILRADLKEEMLRKTAEDKVLMHCRFNF